MIPMSGDSSGLVVVEGVATVFLLLESPRFSSQHVFLETGRHGALLDRCRAQDIPCEVLSREKLDGQAGFRVHRGVFATALRPAQSGPDGDFLENANRVLIVSDFGDPCVLGTLVRTAEAFGVDGVIVDAEKGADPLSRKAIRASAGALLRLPVFEAGHLESTLSHVEEEGFVLLGLSLDSEADSLPDVLPGRKTAVMIGGNEKELPPGLLSQCAQKVRIPASQGSGTLSVAAAGAAMLYELFGRK
jgi:tRNA G18 (ribose-2'-O)-methylase SpoU